MAAMAVMVAAQVVTETGTIAVAITTPIGYRRAVRFAARRYVARQFAGQS